MSMATTVSRVTGFLRIWATAYALGATALMSSYSVANNIPNMIFELVAGGIISSLFIPTLMEVRAERGEEGAWRFTSHVFNVVALALGIIAVIGTLLPQPFVWTQMFRLSAEEATEVFGPAMLFFRFFAVQVLIYGAGSIVSAVLNSHRRYLWPALGPIFNNIVAIAAMLGFVALKGDLKVASSVLAIGTTLGVAVMFGVQVPSLRKIGWRHTWGLGLDDPALRRMIRLAVPTLIYTVTNLVAVSFRNASAFAVAPNGPSILTYAWTFYQLPYGIVAVALATAIFTELADSAGRKDNKAFKDTFSRGLRTTGVLMLPASALLIGLSNPLISLYSIGAFSESASSTIPQVAGALRFWSAGLIFYATTMFLLRAFYSLKDTRTPMLVNGALTLVQVGLYTLLTTGLGGWSGLGINGIPLADAVFFVLMCVTLAIMLRKRIGGYDFKGIASTFVRMALASAIAGFTAWAVTIPLDVIGGFTGAVAQVVVGGVTGFAVALWLGGVFRVKEVSTALGLMKRVVTRKRST
jgi:putative peptidoglycan lipid II flippase